MKVGLIARAEDRGLGILTWEIHRHLQPDRTLLVDMGALARGFPAHPDRYPGATVVHFSPDGHLPEHEVRQWMDGLDVIYSAETFYDWRVCTWAAEARVATVLHVMPEFHRHHSDDQLPQPSTWWAPTTWRLSHLPEGTRLVNIPVATEHWNPDTSQPHGRLRVLHVAGHRAALDRNGTNDVIRALPYIRQPMQVTILTQDRRIPAGRAGRLVDLRVRHGGVPNYWQLYQGQDVLVMPRRYGGLCLPAQEAMGAGLAVAMSDTSPNTDDWPAVGMPCRPAGHIQCQAGAVDLVQVMPQAIAAMLDQLTDPELLAAHQTAARQWAFAHSWRALLPTWRDELFRATLRARATD